MNLGENIKYEIFSIKSEPPLTPHGDKCLVFRKDFASA
jgi:hypothetical protein